MRFLFYVEMTDLRDVCRTFLWVTSHQTHQHIVRLQLITKDLLEVKVERRVPLCALHEPLHSVPTQIHKNFRLQQRQRHHRHLVDLGLLWANVFHNQCDHQSKLRNLQFEVLPEVCEHNLYLYDFN